MTDGNAEFHDFSPGYHLTWGCSTRSSTMDDWFLAELTLIWHANPVYTNIHWYHYVAESRYNGGEVVTIAPDYSPSAIHADYHLPVRIGTDAALALAMCKVIIDAGLYNKQFVQEQTDLPLLVRKDTGRFLRGTDVAEDDREDQFFWWDDMTGVLDAGAAPHPGHRPVSTPRSKGATPSRSRTAPRSRSSRSSSGCKRHLENYTPEKAAHDLRDPPRQHPQARPQGGHAQDQDLHRLEFWQVLPRRSDGARDGAAARPHGQLGQEGHGHALVGARRAGTAWRSCSGQGRAGAGGARRRTDART